MLTRLAGGLRQLLRGLWIVTAALVMIAVYSTQSYALGSPDVTFIGGDLLGLPLLACASQPDQPSVSIDAGTSIDLRNRTGHAAAVYLNGTSQVHVADNSTTSMQLAPGSWNIMVVPDCLLNLNAAGALAVTVAAVAVPLPGPPTPRPGPTMTSGPPKTTPTSAPTTAPPPTDRKRPAPTTPPPSISTNSQLAPSAASVQPSQASPPSSTDPFVDAIPIPAALAEKPPNYLLTLIAALGIVGVGSAAIRALLSRRSSLR